MKEVKNIVDSVHLSLQLAGYAGVFIAFLIHMAKYWKSLKIDKQGLMILGSFAVKWLLYTKLQDGEFLINFHILFLYHYFLHYVLSFSYSSSSILFFHIGSSFINY